ncbi:nucleoside triphosphate pyrophosphohydrolase [Metabacillus sp. GX 13764]|uniref:nucleoside triphosphate pyrophosphohydrolase n=1 Tax=Metabacillus kandeliae TaxID=2900151 RepID=UPI001E54D01A|nr:nucleoside triphosphate pyrophosphohydrolase [Metabacillus kandeliae]MCD7034140.1 nucleoside triphosphate pyrophosphohydrolase [Metabacillus kandeliae]
MPTYNKLVRDRIPEIIEATGKSFETRILEKEEYITELKKKSYEELEEYMAAESNAEAIEELADLLEIIKSFAELHGSNLNEVDNIRKEKAEKRGGFEEKIFLVQVED